VAVAIPRRVKASELDLLVVLASSSVGFTYTRSPTRGLVADNLIRSETTRFQIYDWYACTYIVRRFLGI
jgi:hypothetical protein